MPHIIIIIEIHTFHLSLHFQGVFRPYSIAITQMCLFLYDTFHTYRARNSSFNSTLN